MRAWLLPGFNDIASMTLSEVPAPVPGADEILLDVQFASLNPADRYLSIGQYPGKLAFPHILGRDGVGRVAAVGANVAGISPGDIRLLLRSEVGVSRWGTLADQVTVPAATTVAVPAGWSLEEAVAAPLVYLTAWQALTQWGPLPERTVVLITGASGGVGTAAVQLGKAMGLRTVALSRSAEKAARLREMGAEMTFDPSTNWRDELKAALPQRVDLAIDNIGGELFSSVVDVMGMHGRISVVGRLGGPVPQFNTSSLFFRRLRIGGVAVGTYTAEESQDAWRQIVAALGRIAARPVIDRVFDFADVPAAFARLKEGPMGKVLVRVK